MIPELIPEMSSEAQIYCVSGVKDWFASSPLDRTIRLMTAFQSLMHRDVSK